MSPSLYHVPVGGGIPYIGQSKRNSCPSLTVKVPCHGSIDGTTKQERGVEKLNVKAKINQRTVKRNNFKITRPNALYLAQQVSQFSHLIQLDCKLCKRMTQHHFLGHLEVLYSVHQSLTVCEKHSYSKHFGNNYLQSTKNFSL